MSNDTALYLGNRERIVLKMLARCDNFFVALDQGIASIEFHLMVTPEKKCVNKKTPTHRVIGV